VFDRFTENAKQTMNLARQEAQRLGHDYLGTEHIFLGVLRLPASKAVLALQKMGIDPSHAAREVDRIVKHKSTPTPSMQLPFTPRAKKVLELSMEAAGGLGHNYIGTEHVLLGLVGEKEGLAAQVLLTLGASIDKARAAVLEVLGSGGGELIPRSASESPRPRPPPREGWEHGTDRVRSVMTIARCHAQEHGHPAVWPEHVLAALVIVGKGVAADALARMGVDPQRIRDELAARVRSRGEPGPTAQVPLGAATGTVLELAREEAQELQKHGSMSTGHLLLGLVRAQGAVPDLLRGLGVRYETARKAVVECQRAIDDDPIWDRMG
jgi:ATP-dependent Clp protease ATP-binding subunit ClpA